MTTALQVIDRRQIMGREFSTYGDFENPLFLAKDVAERIEYDPSSIHKMLTTVDDDEKVRKIVPTLGGPQECWFLTEDGLYEVLFQSRKPVAKQFKKDVKAVLKEIRKNRTYSLGDQSRKPTLRVVELKQDPNRKPTLMDLDVGPWIPGPTKTAEEEGRQVIAFIQHICRGGH